MQADIRRAMPASVQDRLLRNSRPLDWDLQVPEYNTVTFIHRDAELLVEVVVPSRVAPRVEDCIAVLQDDLQSPTPLGAGRIIAAAVEDLTRTPPRGVPLTVEAFLCQPGSLHEVLAQIFGAPETLPQSTPKAFSLTASARYSPGLTAAPTLEKIGCTWLQATMTAPLENLIENDPLTTLSRWSMIKIIETNPAVIQHLIGGRIGIIDRIDLILPLAEKCCDLASRWRQMTPARPVQIDSVGHALRAHLDMINALPSMLPTPAATHLRERYDELRRQMRITFHV